MSNPRDPGSSGEYETLQKAIHDGFILPSCKPIKLEAQEVISKKDGKNLHSVRYDRYDVNGVWCINTEQENGGICPNLEFRVCCDCETF